jgi:hypothetical protein
MSHLMRADVKAFPDAVRGAWSIERKALRGQFLLGMGDRFVLTAWGRDDILIKQRLYIASKSFSGPSMNRIFRLAG